jgi:CheY-like chemotaxis protein/glycine cleavage system H lipoate-binding protein
MMESREILIVEDEPVVLESARRILEAEGLSVDLASDAATAFDLLRKGPYKVVLCDLMLPGSSGFRILESLQRDYPGTESITITGYATREHAIESFRLGVFDFLPKPFDVDELLAVVTRALFFNDTATTERPETEIVPRLKLGRHAWAVVDDDGSATLGVCETFSGTLGKIDRIGLPAPDRRTAQGNSCARIHGRDGLVHRVRAPLSGRVFALNKDLETEPDLLDRDPFGRGWLVRIVPENLEEELPSLIRQQPIGR